MTSRRAFSRIEAVVLLCVAAGTCAVTVPVMHAGAQISRQSASVPERMRILSQGVALWAIADGGQLPLAYVYGAAESGSSWNIQDQNASVPNPGNGYVHWSWWLMSAGLADEQMFGSPDAPRGGAPRANPGSDTDDWEPGQVNTLGSGVPTAAPLDRQASRVAFAPNAALMPRNLLVGPSPRLAQRVHPSVVSNPQATIVLSQLLWTPTHGWRGVFDEAGVSKSYRPLTPFLGISSGIAVFDEPTGGSPSVARYRYTSVSELSDVKALICCGFSLSTELNLVLRNPVSDRSMYAFLDGHVAKQSLSDTIVERMWGDRFYSMTGNNVVAP